MEEKEDLKKFSKEIKQLDQFMDTLQTKEGKLIAVLHYAQELIGFLPEELQRYIAEKMKIPPAKVFGVVTFYSFFTQKPKGENKICVCLGTACFVRGAQEIYNDFRERLNIGEGEVTPDGRYSLDGIRCVGACGLAPVVSVNGKVFGRVTKEDIEKILQTENLDTSKQETGNQ